MSISKVSMLTCLSILFAFYINTSCVYTNQFLYPLYLFFSVNHDHSYHLECTDPLLKELNKKDEKIMMLEEKIRELEFQMGKLKFRLETFEDDDNMIRFYTGFPSYKAFCSFFTFLEPRAKWMRRWRGSETSTPSIAGTEAGLGRRKLKLQDELFVVLARLRLNLLVSDISLKLGISEGQFSKMLTSWISFLNTELSEMMTFPSKELVMQYLPESFSEFPNTRVVIDCTELYVQRPSNLKSQKQTWSSYKHWNTFKVLVGVTPDGHVSFLSPLFSGAITDREITVKSGLLEKLEPGDNIMADRGFEIDEDLPEGVTINLPSFKPTEGKQFSITEVEKSQKIAVARVHVERVIGRIKSFRIIKHVMPLSLQPLAEKIFRVCAFLVNLQTPVMKADN